MRNRTIPILIGLMSLALIGITLIQFRWIDNAIEEKQKLIDNNVYQSVAVVEEQLNDDRAIHFLSDTDLGELGMAAFMGPLALGVEQHEEIRIGEEDSTFKMEIQVMTSDDEDQEWKSHDKNIHIERHFEHHIDGELDSSDFDGIKDGLSHIGTVLEKIKYEIHSEDDSRVDSLNFGDLLSEELASRDLGEISNWGIWDNEEAVYTVSPAHRNKTQYDIPLFTADVVNPGRYDLRLSLNTSDIIWSEIWPMILLSIVFVVIIGIVFAFSIKLVIKHKKISQIKSDFINNMTHEFKTPLASISLAADSLVHPNTELSKDGVQKYVDIIQAEKNKLNAQVERILEVAALSKDALNIPLETVEVQTVLDQAMKKFQLQSEQGTVELKAQSAEGLTVNANEFHLENVLVNLIENSIKYSEGKPQISISVDQENSTVEISDKGIGMTPKQLSKVFDNFYRAQSGDLHTTKGFGLGLSYCKLVIEKMGGSIFLKSNPDQGTTAIIKLNRA